MKEIGKNYDLIQSHPFRATRLFNSSGALNQRSQTMRVAFLCIVCVILVDQANSAHILGWMASQQQLPKDQRYKSVNRVTLLPGLTDQNNAAEHRVSNGRPEDQPENQPDTRLNDKLVNRPKNQTDQQLDHHSDDQPNVLPEQLNLLGTEPTAPERPAKQTGEIDLLNQSDIKKLLFIAKIERQEMQNASKLLSEVGLLPGRRQRCKTNEDCLSSSMETYCGELYCILYIVYMVSRREGSMFNNQTFWKVSRNRVTTKCMGTLRHEFSIRIVFGHAPTIDALPRFSAF